MIKNRNYLEDKILHSSLLLYIILSILLYKIYPQEVKVFKNKCYQIKITAMLLFSNSIQINIGIAFSKKPVAKAKVLKFVFWEYKTPHTTYL